MGQPEPDIPVAKNEFLVSDLEPGQARRVTVNGESVAVFNVDGAFYATQEHCTHMGGPLSRGSLNGKIIVCPLHGSNFDVTTGAVMRGPATKPLQTYRVVVENGVGRIEKA